MILFNTFSNRKRYTRIPEIDILIWAASLVNFKRFGYTLKLYCLPSDIEFLQRYHLYELYDIIDVDFLKENEQLKKINENIFWSSRKIEALYHELVELHNDSVYMDTDILLWNDLDFTECDVFVWSPEPRNIVKDSQGNIDWTKTIYVPWKFLSKPSGYIMPEYILNTSDAYNCGILYFKNIEVFKRYREQYYAFCINNPGKIKHLPEQKTNNTIFPCNAEQRILKAILINEEQKVKCAMDIKGKGISKNGIHFFWYRANWQFIEKHPQFLAPESLKILNSTIAECLVTMKKYNESLFTYFTSLDWLRDFELKLLTSGDGLAIKKYY